MPDFKHIATQCRHALTDELLPFWLAYACDGVCGGYFDYLTADGSAPDADKMVARQAEQVWAFAYLYTTLDAQPDWLDHALHGADFLAQYAHTPRMGCYTHLNRTGQPILAHDEPVTGDPLTCGRVASAYAQVYLATNDDSWAMLAKQTLLTGLRQHQLQREGQLAADEAVPQPLRVLDQPASLLRALHDARPLFAAADWKEAAEPLLDEILNEFLDKRYDLLRTHTGVGGAFSNTPLGRRVDVGLSMDVAGLLIDVGASMGNRKLTLQATNWCFRLCQWAWPDTPDHPPGLPRYLDWKGQPLVFVGATDRRAGDHLLALSALANGYWHTRYPDAPRWLSRLGEYVQEHFPDPTGSAAGKAWHPVLTAQHQPVGPFKTTADEGCYALVRGLTDTWQYLEQCARLQPARTQRLTSKA